MDAANAGRRPDFCGASAAEGADEREEGENERRPSCLAPGEPGDVAGDGFGK